MTAALAVVLAFSSVVPNALAQDATASAAPASGTSSAAQDVKVDDIVTRALTAYGGREALTALEANSTAYGKQTATDTGQTLVYRCERKGNKWRIDLESS